eukprot:30255-Hanusia_phi.AAC.2
MSAGNNAEESSTNSYDEESIEAFRSLMQQSWTGKKGESAEFDGYAFRDLIVEKWGVPYDIQIKREYFLGKPMIFYNVMWKWCGQQSFPLTETEYLEHLQFLAELCVKWDRVDRLKEEIAKYSSSLSV